MLTLKFSLGFSSGVAVGRVGLGGGLALLWNSPLNISLQSFSISHIDVFVESSPSQLGWFFTGFYGHPRQKDVVSLGNYWSVLVKVGLLHGFVGVILMRYSSNMRCKGEVYALKLR